MLFKQIIIFYFTSIFFIKQNEFKIKIKNIEKTQHKLKT